jgi:hypothetical protein
MLRSLILCMVTGVLLAARAALATAAAPAAPDSFLTYHSGPTTASLQWILRFQLGQGILPAESGVVGAVFNDRLDSGHSSLVMAVSGLRALNWHSAAGLEGRVETNSLTLGVQSFHLSSWDLLPQYELGQTAVARRPGSLTPYLQLGAGWSFHAAVPSALWPMMAGGGPSGAPVSMKVTSGPALEGALGLDVQANRGIALNLQAGYRRDEPRYRIAVSGEPDRSGTLHLSEACIRGCAKFLLGRVDGGRR